MPTKGEAVSNLKRLMRCCHVNADSSVYQEFKVAAFGIDDSATSVNLFQSLKNYLHF